jgi:hypothetical protein
VQEKPDHLKARGGVWFESETLKVHLGVDPDFVPAQKAHPDFSVTGLAELASTLSTAGCKISEEESIDGKARFFTKDPFGNRIEFIELMP